MNQIMINYYSMVLRLTGVKQIAYFAAILVVTILYIVTIIGLASLLSDILPTKIILVAFSFPLIFVTSTVIFIFNTIIAPKRFLFNELYTEINYSKIILSLSIPLSIGLYAVLSGMFK